MARCPPASLPTLPPSPSPPPSPTPPPSPLPSPRYTLSEKGLVVARREAGEIQNKLSNSERLPTERAIFDFLNLEYVEPEERRDKFSLRRKDTGRLYYDDRGGVTPALLQGPANPALEGLVPRLMLAGAQAPALCASGKRPAVDDATSADADRRHTKRTAASASEAAPAVTALGQAPTEVAATCGIFDGVKLYAPRVGKHADTKLYEAATSVFKNKGGCLVSCVRDATHVILDRTRDALESLEELAEIHTSSWPSIHNEAWISWCSRSGRLMNDAELHPSSRAAASTQTTPSQAQPATPSRSGSGS